MPDVTYIERDILEVVDVYESELKLKTLSAHRLEGPALTDEEVASHLLWLCGEIRREIREGKLGNLGACNRHLSFIRGALWATGKCDPVH